MQYISTKNNKTMIIYSYVECISAPVYISDKNIVTFTIFILYKKYVNNYDKNNQVHYISLKKKA